MATRHRMRSRSEVIRCKNCGEDYSVTYKRCPFCDEAASTSTSRRGRGGKRLSNTRGGGYGGGWSLFRIITTILSLGLIIAAGIIVLTIVKPLVDLGSEEPGTTVSPAVSPSSSAQSGVEPSDSSVSPSAQVSSELTAPPTNALAQGAQSFTLNANDFTLLSAGETYQIKATFIPSGSTGDLAWTSSNPDSVSVASDGTVTAVSNGNSTITAALPGGYSQTCIVRCSWSGSTTPSSEPAGSLSLNRTDMTLSKIGETFTLKVSGTSSTPTWSSSNNSIVSVSSSGKVTALASGTVTISATVDGQTLKCIVRCNF